MTVVEITLTIGFIFQIIIFLSKLSDIENTQSQDRVNFNHEIGYIKKRIESLDEKIDSHRIGIRENLGKIKDDLSREIESFKSEFYTLKGKREVYSEFLDRANNTIESFLEQIRYINSKVDDYTKSIDKINTQQKYLDKEFQDINKHLELFKSNLLIDNHNKGKKNEKG